MEINSFNNNGIYIYIFIYQLIMENLQNLNFISNFFFFFLNF